MNLFEKLSRAAAPSSTSVGNLLGRLSFGGVSGPRASLRQVHIGSGVWGLGKHDTEVVDTARA